MLKKLVRWVAQKDSMFKFYEQEYDINNLLKNHISIELEEGIVTKEYTAFTISGYAYVSAIIGGFICTYKLSVNKWEKIASSVLDING